MDNAGQVRLIDDAMLYSSNSYQSWQIGLNDIKVIGEFTNEDGPYCEDHFLVFVTDAKGWHELPFGADGFSAAITQLQRRFGGNLEPRLSFTTSFDSAVLWPFEMKGKKLFHFPRMPPLTIWRKLLGVFGIHSVAQAYDRQIIRYLK